MKYLNIFSVTLKSAITPSFKGLTTLILAGVRPNISFASLPTACTSPVRSSRATAEGSLTTMPRPQAKTRVLTVPKSIAKSAENQLNNGRRLLRESRVTQSKHITPTGLIVASRQTAGWIAAPFLAEPAKGLAGGTSCDLPPVFSPGIMRLSPDFVRPTCLSPQRGWGCGARGRPLRPLGPHHFCRSSLLTERRTPLVYDTASYCAVAFRCSPASSVRFSPARRPDR